MKINNIDSNDIKTRRSSVLSYCQYILTAVGSVRAGYQSCIAHVTFPCLEDLPRCPFCIFSR